MRTTKNIDLTPNNDVWAARANKRRRLNFYDDDSLPEAPAALYADGALDLDDDVPVELPINSVDANKTYSNPFCEQTATAGLHTSYCGTLISR